MKDIREKKKQIKEEYDIKYSIFKILNTLGECFIKNYTPLEIFEDDYYILIDLAKERLRYIKETIEYNYESNVFGIFAIFAFKSLFIGANDLKIEEINQEITYFNIILKYADTKKIEPELQEFIKSLEKNINDKEKKLFKKMCTNDIIYFIYLLVKSNQPKLLDINEFLVRVMESECLTDKDFEYEELAEIPNENIIDDLYKIFFVEKITNNFHLHIDNRHIKVNKFTNDELVDCINSSNLNITEKIKNENKSKNLSEIKEIAKKSNIDDKQSPQKYQELEKQIEIMQRQINELYDYKVKNENETKKENKLINTLKNETIKKNKLINSLSLQMTNNNTEIYRIKSDLKLIKLHRSLKELVNYLYIRLNLKGGFDYESKITKIIEKLKTFTSIKYNKDLVEDTINFMKELYDKIELGNFSAHNLDLKVSVLDQIFELIDKENKAGELKSKLKNETNAD